MKEQIIITLLAGGGIVAGITTAAIEFVKFLIQRSDKKEANTVVSTSFCKERGKQYEKYFTQDKEQLDKLSDVARINTEALKMLIRSMDVALEHMATNNATGRIAESRDEINRFLVDRMDDTL